MDVESLESGFVDPWEDFTAGLSSITNNENDNEGHKPCHLLATDWRMYDVETNITKLRAGAAAACQDCSLVLDAITSYSSGRLSMENIIEIAVLSRSQPIRVHYQSKQSPKAYQYNNELPFVELELF